MSGHSTSSQFRPANTAGVPLLTVEEAAPLVGLSVWHLKERTRGGRGKKITGFRIGKRWWYDRELLLRETGKVIQTTTASGTASDVLDWL